MKSYSFSLAIAFPISSTPIKGIARISILIIVVFYYKYGIILKF